MEDEIIGTRTFDKTNIRLAVQDQQVLESRHNLINSCIETHCRLENTVHDKAEKAKATYNENQCGLANRAVTRTNYETLDYIIAPNRLKTA